MMLGYNTVDSTILDMEVLRPDVLKFYVLSLLEYKPSG